MDRLLSKKSEQTTFGMGESPEYLAGILKRYSELSVQYAGLTDAQILEKLDNEYGHKAVSLALQQRRS